MSSSKQSESGTLEAVDSDRVRKLHSVNQAERTIAIPDTGWVRFFRTFGRAFRYKCPYCGGAEIFKSPFDLKDRCPSCKTLFAYEEGYFVGAYAVSVSSFVVLAALLSAGLIIFTELSVLQMQIVGASLLIGLPILLYPLSLLVWIALDITVHPPGDYSSRLHHQ